MKAWFCFDGNLKPEPWQTGKELSFSRFMYLLYDVMYKYPGSTLAGTYGRTVAKAVGGGTGEQSQLWVELKEVISTL